jgi:hypothetical protein
LHNFSLQFVAKSRAVVIECFSFIRALLSAKRLQVETRTKKYFFQGDFSLSKQILQLSSHLLFSVSLNFFSAQRATKPKHSVLHRSFKRYHSSGKVHLRGKGFQIFFKEEEEIQSNWEVNRVQVGHEHAPNPPREENRKIARDVEHRLQRTDW